jgi:cytochrome c-type biogenesis protein CcmH/NrfF
MRTSQPRLRNFPGPPVIAVVFLMAIAASPVSALPADGATSVAAVWEATAATAATERQQQTPDWRKTYARLITEIMSPYCHGLTLDNCPTQGAAELRDEIRTWLEEGREEAWILDELELRFGPSILGSPRMRGMGLVAWIGPPLFFLAGMIGVLAFLRRRSPASGGSRAADATAMPSPDGSAAVPGSSASFSSADDTERMARVEAEAGPWA